MQNQQPNTNNNNQNMKSLLIIILLSWISYCRIDPYRVLGVSSQNTDSEVYSTVLSLISQYHSDPLAFELVLISYKQIALLRNFDPSPHLRTLTRCINGSSENLMRKGRTKLQSVRIMEALGSIILPNQNRLPIEKEQADLEDLFSIGTVVWMFRMLVRNTLVLFMVWLAMHRCYQLTNRYSK